MKKYEFIKIGIVKNSFNEPVEPKKIKAKNSIIEIDKKYSDGLLGIEENEFIDVIFYFHRSDSFKLIVQPPRHNHKRGLLASRSPNRINPIGVTTVKLLKRNGNTLVVAGLDAINGTPVLDIKNTDTSTFAREAESNPVHQSKLKTSPRIEIRNDIYSTCTDSLMIKAAQMHGHYCPGLALGIMAATFAMKKLDADSNGMEDLLAITETNNCFSDGVQFVTGCTFGNNSLIFKDLGKVAFTLTKRDGKGIRICSKPGAKDEIRKAFPDFKSLYTKVVEKKDHDPKLIVEYKKVTLDRAFGTLTIPFDKLFAVKNVKVAIPEYAGVHESVNCKKCGESVMKIRTKITDKGFLCFSCSNQKYPVLDGDGIHF